eukprot:TRINITY_DN101215_c0_g1_i1.p1 TRINITY_DN101215_c0_g1~~TRINITY_DN101215_c0_g1_i1.p1  ORF type:complete len:693 (+),score=310.20 TRINITY_DN101215_c0_g1_i1:119-2197(+)
MVRSRALATIAAVLGSVVAVRVDEDEGAREAQLDETAADSSEDVRDDRDLHVQVRLASRAGDSDGAELQADPAVSRLLDASLGRKRSAAEKETHVKTVRSKEAGARAATAAKALSKEDVELARLVEVEKSKSSAAKGVVTKASAAVGREKAELTAADKAAARAETPDSKRKADEEAAFAGAKMRKAEAEARLANISMQRANEEATKTEEEYQAAKNLTTLKRQEADKNFEAAGIGADRQKAEEHLAEKKMEFRNAQRAYDLDEAAELRALAAHNKPDADAAADQVKKERELLDAAAAARKKAQEAAAELEAKMVTASEEAQKAGEEAIVVAAKNKEMKADRLATKYASLAKSEKVRKDEEIKRSEEAVAAHNRAVADAAAAEAKFAKVHGKAAETAAAKLTEEVKARQQASAAAQERVTAEKQIAIAANDQIKQEESMNREAAALRTAVLEHDSEKAKALATAVKKEKEKVKAAVEVKRKAEEEATAKDSKEQEDIKTAEKFSNEATKLIQKDKDAPCADEHGLCMCKGVVVYGRKYVQGKAGPSRTLEQTLANRIRQKPSSWGLLCSNIVFGDPAAGMEKHCFCRDTMRIVLAERKAFRALQEAQAALSKVYLVRKAFHKEQRALEDAVELGEKDAEKSIERAYSQAFISQKRIQKAENEALRVAVENGGGEEAMDAIGVHDLLKARSSGQ